MKSECFCISSKPLTFHVLPLLRLPHRAPLHTQVLFLGGGARLTYEEDFSFWLLGWRQTPGADGLLLADC